MKSKNCPSTSKTPVKVPLSPSPHRIEVEAYLEFEDVEDGHKRFCVDDGGVVGQASDDGGLHIVPRSINHLGIKEDMQITPIRNEATFYTLTPRCEKQGLTFPPHTTVPPCSLAFATAVRYCSTACLVWSGP